MNGMYSSGEAETVDLLHEYGVDFGQGFYLARLHHTGAKSGRSYTTPLMYRSDGDRYLIFGSKGGAPTHADWYHNLKAHPDVSIEVGTDTIAAVADEVTGEERDRIYAAQAQERPMFAEYAEKATGRTIPVIALTPAG